MRLKGNRWLLLALLTMPTWLAGCEKSKEQNTLLVSPAKLDIPPAGGTDSLTIETNAANWKISSSTASWIQLSHNFGKGPKDIVVVTVNTQTTTKRSDTLIFTAGDATPVKVVITQEAAQLAYTLTTNTSQLNFSNAEDSATITITTNVPQWDITPQADWITCSRKKGQAGTTEIKVYVTDNPLTQDRSADLIISAANAPTAVVKIMQEASLYPSYNTSPLPPDASGMGSNAQQIATAIKIGWNIGNTLEAIGGETAWGNPKVSEDLIALIKASGFNAVRIPCSWNQYVIDQETAQIDPLWLDRVKEVVQYCVDAGLYVILNIHWDGGWLENNCTVQKQKENNAKQKAFWEQIATHLRDFDEHLLFASANEPNVDNAEQMNVLLSYHQTFINAVRATGGKNSYRVLVIQGPSTDIEKTYNLMKKLPRDKVATRMMVEIHYYTPWNFCGMDKDESWGKMFYYWGKNYHSATDPERNATWGEEETVDRLFGLMKSQFVDKGIPVVLGEYAATRRSNLTGEALQLHLDSRAYYHKYVTQQAKKYGLLPFYWDNGGLGSFASGIFDRPRLKVFDQQTLDAIMEGANAQ